MILDEVHTSAADGFREVFHRINARCRIGLTATLVREDNKIQDLDYLIGPLLSQQSWKKLEDNKFLAHINCFEIKCPMTKTFYKKYLECTNYQLRVLMSALNPNKIDILKLLIKEHTNRNQKIIIFCDSIIALKEYGSILNCDTFHGELQNKRKNEVLMKFIHGNSKVIAMSCIGDNSLDIPDAQVVIQITSQHGSRRQQTQRLGRISRPKQNDNEAYFYSLTSADTTEEYFCNKRQSYLENMGYGFKVINPGFNCKMSEEEQLKLIQRLTNKYNERNMKKHSKDK